MASISTKQKKPAFHGRVLNARPDTIDFRDQIYSATVFEVPSKINLDDFKKVGVPVLDQGLEGACTGFGLATVIHYLLRTRKVVTCSDVVSPRMLYEMAKKYDEWDGEDYIGSSARGAMKGWHKHGVCLAEKWPYDPKKPDKALTADRADNAAYYPIGAYYRVNHKDLMAMHNALAEVGVLYATARVHDGWFDINDAGEVPYEGQQIRGGHAFAIVAYDQNGFWIQNSWGDTWGQMGFALVSYDDWLANGTDAWVARLGAPVLLTSSNSIAKTFSVTAASRDGLAFKDLRPHVISLGNNGELKTTGTYGNYENDVKRIFMEYFPEITKDWKKKRILLYAHGGLVSESSILQRLADYRQTLLANEIYPVFFVWNSDLWSTIKNLLQDSLKQRQPEARISSIFDFMLDRLDDALEPLMRIPGKAAWNEMKENAKAATGKNGGVFISVKYLQELQQQSAFGLHLVGHSAGSIFLAPVIDLLVKQYKQPIKSCTLWAPASTMEDLEQSYLPAISKDFIDKFTLFTLTDQTEQDDNCYHIYNKSLLYLISNSFEKVARGTSILGMSKFLTEHQQLNELISSNRIDWITSPNTKPIPDACEARHHGDFDNDISCFESTIARILRADPELQHGDATTASINPPVGGGEAGLRAGAVPTGGDKTENIPLGPSPIAPQIKMRPSQGDFRTRRDQINKAFSDR